MFLVASRMHVAHGTFNLASLRLRRVRLYKRTTITRNALQWHRQIFANISETKRNQTSYV